MGDCKRAQMSSPEAIDTTAFCESLVKSQHFLKMTMHHPLSGVHQRHIFGPCFQIPEERHWFLDWAPSRLALKAALKIRLPMAGISILGQANEFDFDLDLLVEELGLREIPKPPSVIQRWRLFWVLLKLLYQTVRHRAALAQSMQGD